MEMTHGKCREGECGAVNAEHSRQFGRRFEAAESAGETHQAGERVCARGGRWLKPPGWESNGAVYEGVYGYRGVNSGESPATEWGVVL